MRSHSVGLDVWFLVGPFVLFRTSCVRTARALVRLRGCEGSPEPSLVTYVISTIISWACSNVRSPRVFRLFAQDCLASLTKRKKYSGDVSSNRIDFIQKSIRFIYYRLLNPSVYCSFIHVICLVGFWQNGPGDIKDQQNTNRTWNHGNVDFILTFIYFLWKIYTMLKSECQWSQYFPYILFLGLFVLSSHFC